MRESVVFNEDWRAGLQRYGAGSFDLVLDDVPYGIGVGKMAYLREAGTTVKQRNGSRLNPRKRNRGSVIAEAGVMKRRTGTARFLGRIILMRYVGLGRSRLFSELSTQIGLARVRAGSGGIRVLRKV